MADSFQLETFSDSESCTAAMCYTPHNITEGSFERLPVSFSIGAHLMKAHILVVDDDPRITDLLRRIFAYEGYSVAVAASGRKGRGQRQLRNLRAKRRRDPGPRRRRTMLFAPACSGEEHQDRRAASTHD